LQGEPYLVTKPEAITRRTFRWTRYVAGQMSSSARDF